MTDPKIVVPFKPFVMQEGMTLEDVKNAKNLSAEAKKNIAIFDADGNGTFSKREADVFNATSISTSVFGTSLNTEYKNGEVKTTTIQGNIASFKYAPQGEVKPTEVPVENVVKNDKKEVKTQTAPLQRTTEPRPLPPLTQVVGLDTLTYYSKQDSIEYNQKDDAAWRKFFEAEDAAYREFSKAENAAWRKFFEAENAAYKEFFEAINKDQARAEREATIEQARAERETTLKQARAERETIIEQARAERETTIEQARAEHCSQVKKY